MKIALLYPPPWKLPEPGQPPISGRDGPPPEYRAGDLDGDFFQIPYGLLTLAAEARAHGHQVKVLNLSAFSWREVTRLVVALDAQLWGLSCWTANRRGAAMVARLIKQHHPSTHVIMGGPHAAPMAHSMLQHHPAIDTIAVGESERTLLEVVDHLRRGVPVRNIAGTVFRDAAGAITRGPKRQAVQNLDQLACPQHHFDSHIFMTSRGCPWACTFCGAESQWGRGFRAQSVEYVLDALTALLPRLPVKLLYIKDDTFTTQRKRVLKLCQAIVARGLNFLWSCDTRVDLLTEELVRAMRLAGCQRMSLGVESGAPSILRQVDKKITVDDIVRSTQLAKRYGIVVRYYMMLGNRGETVKTFRQTLDFLARAKPHEYLFSCLSIYPGTRDFNEAERQGWLSREVFFEENFQELKVPFDADDACTGMMNAWFAQHCGLQRMYQPSIDDCKRSLALLGEHHAAHLDLGAAYFRAQRWHEAERHLRRALDLNYPTPGVVYNYLAVIATERGDYDRMMELFSTAAKVDPQHQQLMQNVNRARRWFRERGPARGVPLELIAHHHFQLLERTVQPTLPGPLANDFANWQPAAAPPHQHSRVARAGSTMSLGDRPRGRDDHPPDGRKHLKVVTD